MLSSENLKEYEQCVKLLEAKVFGSDNSHKPLMTHPVSTVASNSF